VLVLASSVVWALVAVYGITLAARVALARWHVSGLEAIVAELRDEVDTEHAAIHGQIDSLRSQLASVKAVVRG
jgi:hypothetical protein